MQILLFGTVVIVTYLLLARLYAPRHLKNKEKRQWNYKDWFEDEDAEVQRLLKEYEANEKYHWGDEVKILWHKIPERDLIQCNYGEDYKLKNLYKWQLKELLYHYELFGIVSWVIQDRGDTLLIGVKASDKSLNISIQIKEEYVELVKRKYY